MSAISIFRGFLMCCILGLLTSCGGGGGGSSDSGNHAGVTGPALIRVNIAAGRTTLAANAPGQLPALGSPFTTDIIVTVSRADGTPIANGTTVQMSIAPITGMGGLTKLDDPATTPLNEFIGCDVTTDATTGVQTVTNCSLNGTLTDTTASGQAHFFFTSGSQLGTATLTATVADTNAGGQLVSATLPIAVASGSGTNIPSKVLIQAPSTPLYIKGLNANDTVQVNITVADGSGQLIADPPAGINNVLVEILPGSPGGGMLIEGKDANGQVEQAVAGSAIKLHTLVGFASFNLLSGTEQGIAVIRVTVDRSDNNVDNGIGNNFSVFDDIRIPLSDGQLFALEFAPTTQVIRNAVILESGINCVGVCSPTCNQGVCFANGTYSQPISVIASDRFGNPVLPGTPISFGLIDAPLAPAADPLSLPDFAIKGTTGDPKEGTVNFEDKNGSFLSPGTTFGAARHGDLLVYEQAAGAGNTPDPLNLESFQSGARSIDQVITNQNLTVSATGITPFNTVFNPLSTGQNGDFGPTVDPGPAVRYTIGRPTGENVASPQRIDENPPQPRENKGVATTTVTYPAVSVGNPVILVAQGVRVDRVNDKPVSKTIGTVLHGILPAPGPGKLTANPTTLDVTFSGTLGTGTNTTRSVSLTLLDVNGNPVPNALITGSVSGQTGIISGTPSCDRRTGANGQCTATVTILPCGGAGTASCTADATITWQVANSTETATTAVTVTVSPNALTANPTTITFNFTGNIANFSAPAQTVVLTLLDANKSPVPGVLITGTVSGQASIVSGTPSCTTGANGQCTATFSLAACASPPATTCTGTATITWSAASSGATATTQVTVTVNATAALTATPNPLTLSGAAGTSVSGTVNVSGGTPPYKFALTVGGLTGASITAGTTNVVFQGTAPAAGTTATGNITVTDAAGASLTVVVSVTGQASTPLTATPNPLTLSGTAGTSVSGTVNVSGGTPPYNFTLNVGNLTGASITKGTTNVVFQGTAPAAGKIATGSITVTDAAGGSLTVVVSVTGSAPTLTLTANPKTLTFTFVSEGAATQPASVVLTLTDANGTSVPNVLITASVSGFTGAISGTPASCTTAANGQCTSTFTLVSCGVDTCSTTATIIWSAANTGATAATDVTVKVAVP